MTGSLQVKVEKDEFCASLWVALDAPEGG